MRKFILVLLVSGVALSYAQDPTVQSILNDVRVDSLIYNASAISGDFSVSINGNTEIIASRNKNNAGNALAADYIEQRFSSFGLNTSVQNFGSVGENVLATQIGQVFPNQKVILCGHYDSMPTGNVSPAADDDGSGIAALIEAARILSQYNFAYTIVYAAWDEEEYGLVGSNYYATQAATNGDSIIGAINMDAIAWDGDDLARVHVRNIANSLSLSTIAVDMNSTYNIGLNLEVNNPGATYSNHASFWNHDFSSILIIEDFDNDGNPHYHTTTDRVVFFDTLYFEKLSKLSFATAATVAVPLSGNVSVENTDSEAIHIYPNPVGDVLHIEGIPLADGNWNLQVSDLCGKPVFNDVITDPSFVLDMKRWSGGGYFIRLSNSEDEPQFSRTVLKR